MNFDFPTIMVVAVLITGAIWAVDAYAWAPKRRLEVDRLKAIASGGADIDVKILEANKEPVIVEYARSFFPVILIVLLLRSFMVEPFRIPSGSMIPTLLVGDFILVNKFSYGLRLPIFHTKIVNLGSPERGDVVVFRYPKDPSIDYIKRVVGLPGDRISYIDKKIYVNGTRVNHELIGPYIGTSSGLPLPNTRVYSENLGEATHDILIESDKPRIDKERIVPEGHYFVMGDNRDNSNDSRFWGTVPEENLVGRAFFIWMNWDFDNSGIAWSRIGTHID